MWVGLGTWYVLYMCLGGTSPGQGSLGEQDEGSPPRRISPKATLIMLTKAVNVEEGPCPAKSPHQTWIMQFGGELKQATEG